MYKIAVASSDGKNVDASFGGAAFFDIYEVEGNEYRLLEKREVTAGKNFCNGTMQTGDTADAKRCGTGKGCGNNGDASPKVELISDCRCIVCKKIGFHILKQLEKKAISGFDVECGIEEALTKIVSYFDKVDSHQSLRGLARERQQL